jgi:asparagine synthetase B (glutamine-hydrolysing)
MTFIHQLGALDPTFAWDGTRLHTEDDLGRKDVPGSLRGSATFLGPLSGVRRRETSCRVLRDPLGINKLFWAREPDETLTFAARPRRLVEAGHPLDAISAVPRGCVIELDPNAPEARERSLVPAAWGERSPVTAIDGIGRRIRETLDQYLEALASRYPSNPAFVCLSGGLDSSGITVLVREHFADAVAVSFDLERAGRASDDRVTAARLARELGMPLLEATVSPDELLEPLDTVLVESIDWRDFNVHASLVNATLASAIALAAPDRQAIVFTGDLANEFLVDYQPERFRGATYYELPRLAPSALRASLVRGLDTSHREIGVFGAWGLPVVQPYGVAVDAYMSIPPDFLRLPDRKERLCRVIFGDLLPPYVASRPKARAQVGDAAVDGSVLAWCVDRGIEGNYLRNRFAELHQADDSTALDRFMRAGRYRASIPRTPLTARASV